MRHSSGTLHRQTTRLYLWHPDNMSYKTTPLYGGALSVDLPADMTDASTFRQIPDTQEVFVSKTDANHSIIIDLLECVPAQDLKEALDQHMEEITRLNGSSTKDTTIVSETPIAPADLGEPLVALAGTRVFTQPVAKFNKAAQDTVTLCVTLLRLSQPASTDVLVTVNHYDPEVAHAVAQRIAHSFSVRDISLFGN